jgi:hypothetical protein
MIEEKNEYIYHYCTIDTFYIIMSNNTIRLSDLNKTNDSMEKKWGKKIALEVLEKTLSDNQITINLKEDYYYDDDTANHYEQASNELDRILGYKTLISCFSHDGDLLSQWRGYGQDGDGISIGFNYTLLKKLLNSQKDIFIDKVIYKRKAQEKIIKQKLFGPAITYMKTLFLNDSVPGTTDFNEYFIDNFDAFCEVLDHAAENICDLIKNPAFEEEKEVRIVYRTGLFPEFEMDMVKEALTQDFYFGETKELHLLPIQFQVKKNKLVAYSDLDFKNTIRDGMIGEIIIGPKCNADIDDIITFLYTKGYDDKIHVRKSQASYQ